MAVELELPTTGQIWPLRFPVVEQAASGVDSVNGQVGDVVLDAADVGAIPVGGAAVTSVNSETGDVTISLAGLGGVSTTDPRLSNARAPLPHSHVANDISDAGVQGKIMLRANSPNEQRILLNLTEVATAEFGTTAGTVAEGNDPRFNNIIVPNFIQPTQPSPAELGDAVSYIWWDTSGGSLTLWIEDGV